MKPLHVRLLPPMPEEENHFSSISGKFRRKWRVDSIERFLLESWFEIKKGRRERKNMRAL